MSRREDDPCNSSFRGLVGVFVQAFAHERDMISQTVQHARVGDRHSEMVGLFLEAIKPRDHVTRVAPMRRALAISSSRSLSSPYMRKTFDRIIQS